MEENGEDQQANLGLLTGCSIHCVTEELETRLLASQDAGRDRSAMETYSQTEICCTWTKRKLKLTSKIVEAHKAILSKSNHRKSMIFSRIWKASDGDI